MIKVIADLHIHSLLSPCGEVEMTPNHIAMRAAEIGVGAIAITDHNASGNVKAAIEAGEKYGVKVFPGMEVECKEEAHIIVLFDTFEQLETWQVVVDGALSGIKNVPERFGAQFIVDADDEFIKEEDRLILGPLKLSAEEVINKVNDLGGICIAAHVDKPSYSLLMQLGFLTPELGLFAAEISRNNLQELKEGKLKMRLRGLNYVTNSDAHTMEDFLTGPKS